MWNLWNPSRAPRRRRAAQHMALAFALLVGMGLLAGCGASAGSAGSSAAPNRQAGTGLPVNGSNTSTASGAGVPGQPSSQPIAQYLIKSLSVSMIVPDTRITAGDLQSWIASADPKSQSAGASYTQDGSSYDILLTFNVEASLYPQIESYLSNYAAQHKGKLISLRETVQDMTNDYVDAQSQLANLRVEQARLQTLMSHAGSLADVLAVEQRLSDVEGQINQTEAHLNQLNGQTTYYTIQIQLTPIATYNPPITQPWNPVVIFHEALSSAQAFGEGLLTLLIWLAVYAVYIVPMGVIIWLIVRFRRQRSARLATPAATPTTSGGAPPAI